MAIVEENGAVIELIKTNLSEEDIWDESSIGNINDLFPTTNSIAFHLSFAEIAKFKWGMYLFE